MDQRIHSILILAFLVCAPRVVAADKIPKVTWQNVLEAKAEMDFLKNLSAYALTCEPGDFEQARSEMEKLSEERRMIASPLVLESWMRRDSARALQFLKTNIDSLNASEAATMLSVAALTAPAEALAIAKSTNGDTKSSLLTSVLIAIARKDPDLAIKEMLAEIPNGSAQVLGAIATSDARKAASVIHRLPPAAAKEAVYAVVTPWLRSSLEEALLWTQKNVTDRESLHHIAAGIPSKTDLLAADEAIATLPKGEFRSQFEKQLPSRLAHADAQAIGAYVRKKGVEGIPEDTLCEILRRLTKSDPAIATEIIMRTSPEKLTDIEVIKETLSSWAMSDPAGALAWAGKLNEEKSKSAVLLRINHVLTVVDIQKAKTQAEAQPIGSLRDEMIANTAVSLTRTSIDASLAWLNSLPPDQKLTAAHERLGNYLADKCPEEGAAELAKLPPSRRMDPLYTTFGRQWADLDTVAAFKWAESLPVGSQRSAALSQMVRMLAEEAPEEALAYLPRASDKERASIIAEIAKTHGEDNPDLIRKLLDQPGAALEKNSYADLIASVAKTNPSAARSYIEKLPESHQRVQCMNQIAWKMANEDPEAAARWASTLPEENPPNNKVYETIATACATFDMSRAEQWAVSLPAGWRRTQAVGKVAAQLAPNYPTKAFQLVKSNADEQNREQLLSMVVTTWSRSQPDRAAACIQSSDLTPQQKEKLLNLTRK